MFWIDRIVAEVLEKFPGKETFLIRDEKTLSGQVHVGSLRGVVIHGVLAEALILAGKKARFIYEFNDADPMDGMPAYLDAEVYGPHMGKPLRNVPSPGERSYQGMTASNLAEYYGLEFLEVIHRLGFQPEITWAYQLYQEGFYDEWIKKALEHPKEIREIYKRIANSDRAEDWMPLQVVCEKCGKIGSTTVVDFDGKIATYRCEPNKVEWAKGCGHEGKIEPWRGKGKLPWKVEWPVKWAAYKVDIEGAGKDHCAASGSHDVAEAIMKEVLEVKSPYCIPYEFFLLEGAKMSSSKGNAASAKAVTDLLPADVFRFLMLMKEPNQPIEFSPSGETIPRLFDRYDEAAQLYFNPEVDTMDEDLARAFFFAQLDPHQIVDRFRPRFSKLVFWLQMPHVDIEKMVAQDKGSALTNLDREELQIRIFYIQEWLKNHAPERYIYRIAETMPESATELSAEQKQFLAEVAEVVKNRELSGEALHGAVHQIVKGSGLKAQEAFPAIYESLMGKAYGPQVGWFMDALDRDFVAQRLEEVALSTAPEKMVTPPFASALLCVSSEVLDRFPGIKSACAELTGLQIGSMHPRLTGLIAALVSETDFEAAKDSPILNSYKEMYRDFGVNPAKRKPSPSMLTDRLAKGKDFPRVNDLVDAYNYIVVKHQCSAGAYDATLVRAPIALRFSKKGELFTGINDKERPLNEGELCYFDSSDACLNRDFNHLDADFSKVTPESSHVYLNMDASSAVPSENFSAAWAELIALVQEVCGGEVVGRVEKA
jgi:lysyl-tRNA synthetase class 1